MAFLQHLRRARLQQVAAIVLSVLTASQALARRPDRWYRMGDDPAQGTSAGLVADSGNGNTYDSIGTVGQGNLQDLEPFGAPAYVSISGNRPVAADTTNNWAIRFNGFDDLTETGDYLLGANLNIPEESAAAVSGGEPYTGITDRGYQLWFQPLSLPATGAAWILDDGEEYEFRIDSTGVIIAETRDASVTTSATAAAGAWTHVAQVRPSGNAGGSLFWVNGIAVASQTGEQRSSTTGLVIGSNAQPDGAGGTTVPGGPGNTAFFDGLVDEIDMFVLGGAFGEFDYTKDNGYFTDVFLPTQNPAYSYVDVTGPLGTADGHNDKTWVEGDINFDGSRNQADIDAFVAGWRSTNADSLVGAGPGVGDYVTLGKGDLDLDGDTDIDDFVQLRFAFAGVAVTMPTAAQLAGAVPEPSTCALMLAGGVSAWVRRRRR